MKREIEVDDVTIEYTVKGTFIRYTHPEDIAMFGKNELEDCEPDEDESILVDDHRFTFTTAPEYVLDAIYEDVETVDCQSALLDELIEDYEWSKCDGA